MTLTIAEYAAVAVLIWSWATFCIVWKFRTVVQRRNRAEESAGWVYFLTSKDDPEAPVKIGMTRRDPRVDRLPEIETMSPTPLKVIHSFYCRDAEFAEAALHDELAEYRMHGEWFDRDAALSVLSMITEGRL